MSQEETNHNEFMTVALAFFGIAMVSQDLSSWPINDYYVNQKFPLTPSPVQKLPAGSIQPKGWLKFQIDLQLKGFSGQLAQISKFLDIKNNAWMSNGTQERAGWEEVPYWLRGQISLAFVSHDPAKIKQCQDWIEGVLKSQQSDGWFGPESNRKTKIGTPDLWPNMLMQDVLQTYYEASEDQRVLPFLTRYCEYLSKLSDDELIDPRHYWHYHRVADQLANLIWLYNRTENPKLITLASRLHKRSSNWSAGIPNYHGVNFAQGFREPAAFSVLNSSKRDFGASERNLLEFRKSFGQFPGGMYAADENARKGFTDPRQATESCAIAEMMFSDELLFLYSADTTWMDRAEEVAFNEFPVTMTPDLKALRYLQAANQPLSDSGSKSPGLENGGPMFLMDPNDHRCCQHNIGMGWPYLIERLWTATNGNGLLASIYSPCEVTAKVGSGQTVSILEDTNYPFRDTINLTIKAQRVARFPLSLRIPKWCKVPRLKVNGRAVASEKHSNILTVFRSWKDGDKVELKLPMELNLQSWGQRPGTLSVTRGPLSYSLAIQEEYRRVPRSNSWDAFEIHPKSPWNYGLPLKPKFTVVERPVQLRKQIFDVGSVPVVIKTRARRIPNWTMDFYGLVSKIQACPAFSKEPEEEIQLIPMGAARLRMTVFPTVSSDPKAHHWIPSPQSQKTIPTTYSFRNWFDNEGACSDGLLPQDSHDESVPRFTWWDHKGTSEWVQYTFERPRTLQRTRVYWFEDSPEGGCRTPESWKIQVKQGSEWVDVEPLGQYGTQANAWNLVEFKPLRGSEIRLLVKLKSGFSGGVLEWEQS